MSLHIATKKECALEILEKQVPGFLKARELCLFSCVNREINKKCNAQALWILANTDYLRGNLGSEKVDQFKKAHHFEKMPLERLKRIATGRSVQMYAKVSFEKGLDRADDMVQSRLGRAVLRTTARAAPLIGCAAGFMTACLVGTPSLQQKIGLPVSPSLLLKAIGVSLAIQGLFSQGSAVDLGMIRQMPRTIGRAFIFSPFGGAITLFASFPIAFFKQLVMIEINRGGGFEEVDRPLTNATYSTFLKAHLIEACALAPFVKIFTPILSQASLFPMLIPDNILSWISAVSAPTSWYLFWAVRPQNESAQELDNSFNQLIVSSSLATTVGILAYMAANRAETLVPSILRYSLSTSAVVADAFPTILHRGITEVQRNKVSTAIDAAVVSVAMVAFVGSGAAPALAMGVSVASAMKCSGRSIVPRHVVRAIVLGGSRVAVRLFRRIFGYG